MGHTPASALIDAAFDLFAVTAGSGALIGTAFALAPGLLAIDLDALVTWPLFVLMLLTNAVVFSTILYSLCLLPLVARARSAHFQVMAHALYVFAIFNFLLTVLFVLAINRVIVNGSLIDSTSGSDLFFGGLFGLALLALAMRALVLPIARYLASYYGRAPAFVLALFVVPLASWLNPVIASGYFEHAVERENFCAALVSIRYQSELASGRYSRDCLIAKCAAASSRNLTPAMVDTSFSACPVRR